MSTDNGQRRPEEIESDIHQARARLDETLHELEERFSPQQLMNTTYEYLRHGGANDFASTLGRTIKENPLPVMLTGAGLVWLIVAQRNSERDDDYYQAGYATRPMGASHLPVPSDDMSVHAARSASGVGGPSVTGAGTTTMGHDPASVGASATHSHATPSVGSDQGMTGKAKEMLGKVKERTQHMGHNMGERTHQLSEQAQEMGDRMRHRTSDMQNGGRSMMHSASDRARYAGSQTTHFIQEHPLVAGALGVAIGAALGSLFPATRVENERLGDMRDRALERAREVGQEKVDEAQEAFHEKAEHARERVHEKTEQTKADAQSRTPNSSNEETYAKAGSTGAGSGTKGSPASTKGGAPHEPEADNRYSTQPSNDHPPTRGG